MRRALLALALLVTACGTGEDPAEGAEPSLSRDERNLEFARCLREHGLDVEDPEPGGGIRLTQDEGPAVDKAMEACREYVPPAPEDEQQLREGTLRFTECLRENGVDVADPEPGKGPDIGPEQTEDPDYAAAVEECGGPGIVTGGAGK